MPDSKDQIETKIPFVRSLLMALGEQKLTLVEVHAQYVRLRPGNMFKKIFTPPADLNTVSVYLKTLTSHGYVLQEVAPWDDEGKAQVILYYIGNNGREFLNSKKK